MAQTFFRKKLHFTRTLGERLKTARKKKKLSLAQAEEETKVRLKYLVALEQGDYLTLPADVYSLGFLAKYAEFLGLNKDQVIQDFRRERGASGQEIIPVRTKARADKFLLTPRTIGFLLGMVVFLTLLGYIFYSVKHFTTAPNLEISSPSTETVIREDRVEVIGKTDIGCSLRINDQTVYIDNIGNFKEVIHLQPGINNVEVRSANRVNKETAKVIKVLAEY